MLIALDLPLVIDDYRSTRRPGHLVALDGWSTRRQIANSIGQLVAKCRRIEIA